MTATTEQLEPALKLFDANISWAEALARNVARKLPPSFDAGDLKQEALIEMWKRAQLYDPQNQRGVPFQAYAYMAVRGACLMAVRRRAWKEATAEEITDHHIDDEPRPDELLEAKRQQISDGRRFVEEHRWLTAAIRELPPVECYLMTRVYIDEVDPGDLAQLLGIERQSLSRRLSSVVTKLKASKKEINV